MSRKPWGKVALPSYGREAVDRQSITLEDETLIKRRLCRQSENHCRADLQFSLCDQLDAEARSRDSST